ncbi:MAG: hypothetical protein WC915_03070 [archaeon]|jgi:hypothetical protein
MDKGFIFTIEALLSILILITSIIVIGGYASPRIQDTIITTQIYGKTINSIYFNKTITTVDANNLFCVEFVDFELTENKLCEGYNEN